jgi:hypothetical protein
MAPKTRRRIDAKGAAKQKPVVPDTIPLPESLVGQFPSGSKPYVIVPFRDDEDHVRQKHLDQFINHFKPLNIPVLVVEQTLDNRKFNRGALLNIGAQIAITNGASHIILHDVDLLPEDQILPLYQKLPLSPIHIGWAWTEKYKYERFFGGIVSMSSEDYKRINGFPNHFWGWGGEDDALLARCKVHGIHIYRPTERSGLQSLPHPHAGDNPDLINATKHRDVQSDNPKYGYSSVKRRIEDVKELASDIHKITVQIL